MCIVDRNGYGGQTGLVTLESLFGGASLASLFYLAKLTCRAS